ncbi:Lhr family ATP-dependent helicase, partial [Escherichia sp. TWPC-MK]
LGIAIVEEQLQQLREQGLVMNLQQDIWVSDEVFRRLRLRSLQAAREATRPVAATTYARLLLERQGVLPATDGSPALFASTSPGVYEGVDGVMRVIEQLAGVGLPASLWESQILPARVRDYSSEMLDELLATGAVIWSGQKKLGEDDGLVALHLQEYAAESFTPAEADQANRLISLPCKRRYGRWSGKASSPATFGHRYAPSPAAVPTHAPQLAAVTGLVVDVLSMRNPSRRWYLTTHQIWLDAGRYCRWSH